MDGKPHLVEYRAGSVDPVVRLVQREAAISEAAMKDLLHQPIMVDRELPMRWAILQDPEAFRVYVVGHHIIVDGQSMSILSQEFLSLLEAPHTTLPPAAAFKDMHMMEVCRADDRCQAKRLIIPPILTLL